MQQQLENYLHIVNLTFYSIPIIAIVNLMKQVSYIALYTSGGTTGGAG